MIVPAGYNMVGFTKGVTHMLEEIQERLTELEIRFSHQTLLLDELNEVVTDCNRRIDLLSQENRQLREMVKNLAPELEESPDE
jgi:SlyX protein